MANWTAIITAKEPVDINGNIVVSYSILRDGETDSGTSDQIQQVIESRVQTFAPQWELAQELQIGQELEIIIE